MKLVGISVLCMDFLFQYHDTQHWAPIRMLWLKLHIETRHNFCCHQKNTDLFRYRNTKIFWEINSGITHFEVL